MKGMSDLIVCGGVGGKLKPEVRMTRLISLRPTLLRSLIAPRSHGPVVEPHALFRAEVVAAEAPSSGLHAQLEEVVLADETTRFGCSERPMHAFLGDVRGDDLLRILLQEGAEGHGSGGRSKMKRVR